MTDWDHRFLDLAQHVAQWSKDFTKVGAVIVNPKRHVVSLGYNGFPAGMEDRPEWYEDRETKYARINHAEKNALAHSEKNIAGCTLYTWPFLPCTNCYNLMTEAGIIRIVAPKAEERYLMRWGDHFMKVRQYAQEMGVEIVEL